MLSLALIEMHCTIEIIIILIQFVRIILYYSIITATELIKWENFDNNIMIINNNNNKYYKLLAPKYVLTS